MSVSLIAMSAPITTTYDAEERERIINHILTELCCGRSVKRILDEDENMPSHSTFWRWHFSSTDLQDQVARARDAGCEALMDETVSIAQNVDADREKIAKAKLEIDTIQKYAQMIAPRKYAPMTKLADPDGNALPAAQTTNLLGDNRVTALLAIAAARKAQGAVIQHQDAEPALDETEMTRRLME